MDEREGTLDAAQHPGTSGPRAGKPGTPESLYDPKPRTMDTWIIYVIAPIAVAMVSWILGKNSRRIDETSKVVTLLQDEIGRLTVKVEKLETKLETKDEALERKSVIIQEAFRCRTPSMKCPVLIKQAELNHYATIPDNASDGPSPHGETASLPAPAAG